ncbi:MAG: hypothetical protein EXR91_00595 [Gemmatimonadetes bacterium]|nr:hypothetical protein [Gemmatimonadota bacterium]
MTTEEKSEDGGRGSRQKMGDGIKQGLGVLSAFKDALEETIQEARERGVSRPIREPGRDGGRPGVAPESGGGPRRAGLRAGAAGPRAACGRAGRDERALSPPGGSSILSAR